MIVNSSLVTFYKNPDQDNEYRIDIRDLDNSGPDYFALKRFTYTSDVEVDEGSLVVQENAILIAPHNKMLNRLDGVWYLNDFVSTTPVVRSSALNTNGGMTFPSAQIPSPYYGGGEQGVFVPSLEQNKEYAYKARYVYRDGHKTKTCFPVYISTTTNRRFNAVEIDMELDIDDGYCDIELFRKQDGGEFFLIERITSPDPDTFITYIDDGKPDLTVLDEKEYVWTSQHKTHAVVRDRYVRANVNYDDRDFSITGVVNVTTSATELSSGDAIVPSNCRVDVFARKRQEDGLLSFHKLIGGATVDTASGDLLLSVKQDQAVADTKELALFARYRGLDPKEFISFNTPEIYNANIASIATHDEDAQDKPINPHVFIGWRYITATKGTSGGQPFVLFHAYDRDWDTKPSDKDVINKDRIFLSSISGSVFPDTYTMNKFGTDILYVKKYSDTNSQVYEMAMFDGLKEAVSRNKVKIKLSSIPFAIGGSLSSEVKNSDILNVIVDVVGIVDTSTAIRLVGEGTNKSNPYSPRTSRVYLLLPVDSAYSKIDNASFIKYTEYKKDLDATSTGSTINIDLGDFGFNFNSYFTFTIYGVTGELETDIPTGSAGTFYTTWENDYFLTDVSGDVVSSSLIYLGKSTNTALTQSNLRTGYVKVISNNFITNELAESNVYETLITEDQLGTLQNEFPTQIVWSDPYIVGTDVSGNRTFNFSNFLSLQRDYGDIVRVEAIANRLLVFCERGVAVVMVGEVLTETVSGQTFVNAVNFLNSPTWILKNIKGIQPRSIKQFEGMLFFSDGQDVWMFGEGLTNISQGAITLAGSQVGAIDVLNQEYRISGGGKTYSYSIGSQQWSGPHTYVDTVSTTYGDRMISVIGGNIAEHNIGNDFAGAEYETIVESVANELNEASVDKIYRKFYIEHENAETFEYGKDYSDMTSKDLADAATKQGLTHIGVNPSNATARQIFWRIKSAVKDFKLKMISFNWTPRTRR